MHDHPDDRMTAWLRQTLDEAEKIARAACLDGAGHWQHHGYVSGADVSGDHDGYHVACDEGYPTLEQARHIALNDPAAVLRQIDRHRRLLDDLLAEPHAVLTPGGSTQIYCDADNNPDESCNCGRDARVQRQLRLIAEGWGWTEEGQK